MKTRLLLADDSATIQKVVALCFADEPVELRTASYGQEAVECLRSWRPDVLLVDALLPGIDGYEMCRQVKLESGIPVVLLVGTFEPLDFERAEASGYDAYLTKPLDSVHLVRLTKELAGRSVSATVEAEKRIGILEFSEPQAAPTPRILQIEELCLTPWNHRITPRPKAAFPPLPAFRALEPPVPAVRSPEEWQQDAADVVDRLLPHWMERIRAELMEELKRTARPGPIVEGDAR
ncbi:MAG: response regulator [Acidobacteria bacterium]|nr:response regulator [Acidobacteriota bacterium]